MPLLLLHPQPAAGRAGRFAAIAVLITFLVPTAATATILLPFAGPPYNITATANDQVSGSSTQTINLGTALPYVDALVASDGDASTTVDISLSQSGFDFDVTFQSAGNPLGGDGSTGFGAFIRFAVDTPTAYAIEGSLSSAETVGNGSAVMFAWLRDASTVLQSDQQESVADGEAFLIEVDGNPGGDNVSTLIGSLNGVLLPGQDYFLNLSQGVGMAQTPAAGVASTGSFSVSFTAVPEPTTGALLGLGIAGIAAVRRRR